MSAVAQEGDVVLLVSPDGKRYLIRLKPSEEWHCHKGCIRHDEVIGKPLGRTLHTQHGYAILALEPSTHDLIHGLPRTTQIIYSKDAAQIVMRLSLYPGRTVVEAGTGSAGLTHDAGALGDADRSRLQLRDTAGIVRHGAEQPGGSGAAALRDFVQ